MASTSTFLRVAAVASVSVVSRAYDCDAELWDWENLWTPDWKEWCCTHEQKGCPSTSTVTTSTETQTYTSTSTATRTSTTTTDGCLADCVFDNRNATCGARIRWLSKHDKQGEPDPCEAAQAVVAEQCGEVCTSCTGKAACEASSSTEAATTPESTMASSTASPSSESTTAMPTLPPTTKATTAATTAPPTTRATTTEAPTTPAGPPCDRQCVLLGESASCADRMRWMAKNQFQNEKDPCMAAQISMYTQCESNCDECTPEAASCTAATSEVVEVMVKAEELEAFARPARGPASGAFGLLPLLGGIALPTALIAGTALRWHRRGGGVARGRYAQPSREVEAQARSREEELLEAMVEA